MSSGSFLSLMSTHHLENYLRTYRKQSGLSQREVAFLVGWKSGEQFSRYEKRRRLPTFRDALACETVFDVPIGELFPGMRDVIASETNSRLEVLRAELEKMDGKGKHGRLAAKKLSWLRGRQGRASLTAGQSA